MTTRYPALDLGPLPVDLVNATLGTEMEPGRAVLSRTAHQHMALDHAPDYPVCIAALRDVVASPTFVGQDPKSGRNFVLVKRVGLAGGRAVLVAIALEPNAFGNYAVRSSYLIPRHSIDDRRAAGRLHITKPA